MEIHKYPLSGKSEVWVLVDLCDSCVSNESEPQNVAQGNTEINVALFPHSTSVVIAEKRTGG